MHYTICRGVYVIGGRELSHVIDNNVFIIELPNNRYILFETGSGLGFLNTLRNILELSINPKNIAYIAISHAHIESSGATYNWLTVAPNTYTVMHEPDASFSRKGDPLYTCSCLYNIEYRSYPISISIPLYKAKYILSDKPYVELIHAPGHTRGFMILYYQGAMKLALVSDIFGPLSSIWGSSKKEYITSLNMAMDLEADRYCTSVRCYDKRTFYELSTKYIELAEKDELWVKPCQENM